MTPGAEFERFSRVIFNGLLNGQDVITIVTDERGLVTWVSPSFERMTGYEAQEVQGKSPGALLQCEETSGEETLRIRRHLDARQPVTSELLNQRKDGSRYWTRIHIVPAFSEDGTLTGFFSTQTDETDSIERRMAADKARSDLLATFSHEVRTPLNAITNLLALVDTSGLTPDNRVLIQDTQEASKGLLSLVGNVLDYSRSARSSVLRGLDEVSITSVVDQLRAVSVGYKRTPGVALRFTVPPDIPLVRVDQDRLFRSLLNLTSNAVKFTTAGSVDVRVEFDREASKGRRVVLRFSVTDTGIGIAEQDLQRILLPFEQVNLSTSRHYEGAGLGLSLTESMVREMGGELQVQSVLGVGSCFSFELNLVRCAAKSQPRLAPASGEQTAKAEPVAMSLKGYRMVLVDDNRLGLMAARKHLERLGATVITACDGRECLQVLAAEAPETVDGILMDLHMPGIDGYETTRLLRLLRGYERTPVIALSGAVADGAIDAARAAGMCDFIPKPFNAQEMARTVLAHLPK